MKALLLIDIQNDFCTGGALAVPDGEAIVPTVNALQQKFDKIIATQDWHPADHGSFAANHPGAKPYDMGKLGGLDQVLWPTHCVQGSEGAEFRPELDMNRVEKIFRKGMDAGIDSYSGFYDNGQRKSTGLGDLLKAEGVSHVYVAGLAADYCVKFTALDARKLGFDTTVFTDATKAVNISPDDFNKAMEEMKAAGVELMGSSDL